MKTIITHPHFDSLWEKLSSQLGIPKTKVSFEKFPDRWPNFFINDVKKNIEQHEVIYIGDFSTPELLFENYVIIRWLLDYSIKEIKIIMPYFPVGTMERINTKGQIATAKYYADIFSLIPSGLSGKTSIHILDIHALAERFFFDTNKVHIDIHTAMSLIKNKIPKNSVIVFPDDWAKKRFAWDFVDYEVIVCAKTRIWDKKEIIITQWNPQNKHVIIIDDLILSGGTLIETTKVLKNHWAVSVSAFCTHGIFPNDSHQKLANHLKKLYVTNSIPHNNEKSKEINNMEVLDIMEIIEKIIPE